MRIRRFLAILSARNKEFLRDRAALAWNFLFPVFVVLGFGFAFSGGNQDLFKVARLGAPGIAFEKLKMIQFIDVPNSEGQDSTLAKLRRHQLDMVIAAPATSGQPVRYWINETAPKGYLLEELLLGSQARVQGASPPSQLLKQTVQGQEIRYVDWLISGLLAMNMMFSALFGVGYVIVRYRKSGVLRRLRATPLGAWEFLAAQVVSRLFLIVGVTVLVYFGCNLIIHFRMQGSYLDLFVVLTAGAICLISLGLLIAARVASEEFAGGLLNLLTWPMMFLSGVWFSLEGSPEWVKKTAQFFPLTHVIDASRAIMTEGATLTSAAVAPRVIALLVLAFAFLTAGAASFKWE